MIYNIGGFVALIYCCQVVAIQEINYKFLESGPTQMEVDSLHSTIEVQCNVYEADGHTKLEECFETVNPNRHNTEQGTVLNWKAVKWLQYKKHFGGH